MFVYTNQNCCETDSFQVSAQNLKVRTGPVSMQDCVSQMMRGPKMLAPWLSDLVSCIVASIFCISRKLSDQIPVSKDSAWESACANESTAESTISTHHWSAN